MTCANYDMLRAITYGLAVGDALGVPYEFMRRGTFKCTGMAGHGTHDQLAGTWSDDTSMALATLDSIAECGRVDVGDMRRRYENWAFGGCYTCGGEAFDIGATTLAALTARRGMSGQSSQGNGSLMRVAPLAAIPWVSMADVRAISAITHGRADVMGACVSLVTLTSALACGGKDFLLLYFAHVASRRKMDVPSTGYYLDTLNAAIWCVCNTETYRNAVLEAVSLGEDTDTTAAVTGAMAGALYGYDAIPGEWLGALRGRGEIERVLRKFV